MVIELDGYPVGINIIESPTKALHISYIQKDYQKNQSKYSYKIKETMIDYL